ncbi:MAG TPA: purine-nucleoside phosphorylase, partial [Anaerolineales bacterium]|nr:purine-nucleoside phosphorylase [Anaerolineales bacterium]
MSDYFALEEIDRITGLIREQVKIQPRTGIILGSGLGSLAESLDEPVKFSYSQLPSWPVSTVEGHAGRLVIGELEDHPVVIMQGRIHYYEGYSMAQIGLPIRVLSRLGIKILIITNAAGAVNPEFEPGDLMLIRDHLNLIG